jgi:DNA-binding transcriptional ArsR family regulator
MLAPMVENGMSAEPDIAHTASLIGDPARTALLLALTEEESLSARELAERAGIAPSTASGHLARLVSGGLLVAERSGRNRYFRLAGSGVADALEALAAVAPSKPVRSLRAAAVGEALRHARTCYDHLAGKLGVELAAALERERVVLRENGGYVLGPRATAKLEPLGIELGALGQQRRALLRACLDWSERRPHVAGALGAAIAERLFELGWIERRARNRSVAVTAAGIEGLRAELGVEVPTHD